MTSRQKRVIQYMERLLTDEPERSTLEAFELAELLESHEDRILFEMSVERDLERLPVTR